jgi:putative cell wall-binding protein
VAGADRVTTAVALAERAHPDGAGTVVVARADAYADALAAAPLAASLDAPVLLTGATGLRAEVAEAVRRLEATEAVLVGGEGALSAQVERDLRALGVGDVRRIAGTNRFDTARRIAGELGGISAYLVEGANADADRGWPDAVALSGLAAVQGRPILLTTRDAVPPETRAALRELGATSVTVVGGTAAISGAVERTLSSLLSVRRVAGATRYDTSAQLAAAAVAAGADASRVWVATGRSWPDALAAGASTGALGVVLLLVDGTDLARSPESAAWLGERAGLDEVVLVGGTGSLSSSVADAIAAFR